MLTSVFKESPRFFARDKPLLKSPPPLKIILFELRLLPKQFYCVSLPHITLFPHQLMFLFLVECRAGLALVKPFFSQQLNPRQLVDCQLQYVGVLGTLHSWTLRDLFKHAKQCPSNIPRDTHVHVPKGKGREVGGGGGRSVHIPLSIANSTSDLVKSTQGLRSPSPMGVGMKKTEGCSLGKHGLITSPPLIPACWALSSWAIKHGGWGPTHTAFP